MRASLVGFFVIAVLTAGRAAGDAPPPLCTDGTFIVQGDPLLGFGGPNSDSVTLAARLVGTATGCVPTEARRFKATRKGTKVVVTWKTRSSR